MTLSLFYMTEDPEPPLPRHEPPTTYRGSIETYQPLQVGDPKTLALAKQVLAIEAVSFPEVFRSELSAVIELLENQHSITVMLYDSTHTLIGFLFSVPQNEAWEKYHNEDPAMERQDHALYIENIAIEPGSRGQGHFEHLFSHFLDDARAKGYTKVTAHCRAAFGKRFQKMGGVFKRTLPEWFHFGEPMDYIEMDISI